MACPKAALASFPVGLLELGFLLPAQQRRDGDAYDASGFLLVALREQGGDGRFHLGRELC